MVTRNGHTFPAAYWVSPNQVQKTDIVCDTKGNPIATADKVDNIQQQSVGNFNINEFDKLKDTDRNAAMKYAQDCGISWVSNEHAGINWMRCMTAVKKAAGIVTEPKKKVKVTVPKDTRPAPEIGTNYDLSSLANLNYERLSKKDKLNALKTIMSREDIEAMCYSTGIEWQKHDMPAINTMRMQMALADWLDEKSLAQAQVFAKVEHGGGPAIKKSPLQDKKDGNKSFLSVPKGATEREKQMIALVNDVSSKDDLTLYKQVGIIAEDEQSKQYLKTTLLPKSSGTDDDAVKKLLEERYSKFKRAYGVHHEFITYGLEKTMKGFTPELIANGGAFSSLMRNSLDSRMFTAPRDFLALQRNIDKAEGACNAKEALDNRYIYSMQYNGPEYIDELITSLHDNFGEYEYFNDYNQRSKTVYSPNGADRMYELAWWDDGIISFDNFMETFDIDKDGVGVALNKIAHDHPELKNTCEEMKKNWSDAVMSVQGAVGRGFQMLNYTPEEIQKKHDVVEANAKLEELSTKFVLTAMSEEDLEAYRKSFSSWKSNTSKEIIVDDQGNVKIVVSNPVFNQWEPISDINWKSKEFNINWEQTMPGSTKTWHQEFEPLLKTLEASSNQIMLVKNPEVFHRRCKENLNFYQMETKNKFREAVESMFGMKHVDMFEDDDNGIPKLKQVKYVPTEEDTNKDCVVTNLMKMRRNAESYNEIYSAVQNESRKSQLNDAGKDLGNVFDWWKQDEYFKYKNYASDDGAIQYKFLDEQDNDNAEELQKHEVEPQKLLQLLKKQHASMKTYSPKQLASIKENLIKYTQERADKILCRNGNDLSCWKNINYAWIGGHMSGLDAYAATIDNNEHWSLPSEHPLFNVMMDDLDGIVVRNKAARNQRIKSDRDIKRQLRINLGIDIESGDTSPISTKDRQDTLNVLRCSIGTMNDDDYKTLQHKVKTDWDNKVHGRNSAKFYGAYEIHNLELEERFQRSCERMGEQSEQYYHGTTFGATEGILGKTGAFRVPKSDAEVKTASMLGRGIYLAKKSSKSAQYVNDYNSGRYGRGTLFVCDAILGKQMPYTGSGYDPSYDTEDGTVCATEKLGSRFSLLNDEWAVRNPDFVLPRVIIDFENARRY
jgi:hypothetical protein